jgi:hypothetical protein
MYVIPMGRDVKFYMNLSETLTEGGGDFVVSVKPGTADPEQVTLPSDPVSSETSEMIAALAETSQAETSQAETSQAETSRPEISQSEASQSEASQSEASQSEVFSSEASPSKVSELPEASAIQGAPGDSAESGVAGAETVAVGPVPEGVPDGTSGSGGANPSTAVIICAVIACVLAAIGIGAKALRKRGNRS